MRIWVKEIGESKCPRATPRRKDGFADRYRLCGQKRNHPEFVVFIVRYRWAFLEYLADLSLEKT